MQIHTMILIPLQGLALAFARANAVRVQMQGQIHAMESISLYGFASKGRDEEGMMLSFLERVDIRGGEHLTPTVGG